MLWGLRVLPLICTCIRACRAYITPTKVEKLHQLYWSDGKVVQELPHIGHIRARILDQIANLRPGTEPSCSCLCFLHFAAQPCSLRGVETEFWEVVPSAQSNREPNLQICKGSMGGRGTNRYGLSVR